MKVSDYYGSSWLSHEDLDDDGEVHIVTIKECYEAEFEGDDDDDAKKKPAQTKIAVEFKEFDKPLLLNKTNAGTIVGLYGNDTEEWIGNRIGIYATEVQFGKKMVGAIRVKPRAPKPPEKPKRSTKQAESRNSKRTSKRAPKRRRDAEDGDDD